jgi:hypothetical protein
MIELRNTCVTLEGDACSSDLRPARWLCPPAICRLARECWPHQLEPVIASASPAAEARRVPSP